MQVNGYIPLQKLLSERSTIHVSSFSDQHGKLFDIPHPRLCIILTSNKSVGEQNVSIITTPYIKLGIGEYRETTTQRLEYADATNITKLGVFPRIGAAIECEITEKISGQGHTIGHSVLRVGKGKCYYTRKMSWSVQVSTFIPEIFDDKGKPRLPSELKSLVFATQADAEVCCAVLNSNLFYWFVTTGSDCRNLNMREVQGLPFNLSKMNAETKSKLSGLCHRLTQDMKLRSELREMKFAGQGKLKIQCIFPLRSKPIIDEIDRVLAAHYGFSDEELDFIINYDIKYRMGRDAGDE